MSDSIRLPLRIECSPDTSPSEIRRLTEWLYRELSQTPVEQVEWKQQPLPPGVKGGNALTPELIVALSVAVLPNLVLFLQKWLLRQHEQVVKIKLPVLDVEIPRDMPPDDLAALVEKLRTISQSDTSE